MVRPQAKPALTISKAPTREHPVVPPLTLASSEEPVPASTPPAAQAQEPLKMYSARINPRLHKRVKRFSVEAERSLQDITEEALTEFLDRQQAEE